MKKIDREKIKKILPYGLVIFFMLMVSLFFYYDDVKKVSEDEGIFFARNIDAGHTIEVSDKEIIQEYTTTRDHIRKIGLGLKKTGDLSQVSLTVKLREKESGNILQKWDIKPNELNMEGDFDYLFLDNILVGKGKTLEIIITARGLDNQNRLEIYQSANMENYGATLIDGEKINNNLALAVAGPVKYLEKIYILMAAGFILLMCMIVFWSYKGRKVKLEKLFLLIGSFLGVMYLIIFSPYSEPDSRAHIATSLYYANVLTGQTPADEEGKVIVRKEDFAGDGYTEHLGLDNLNTAKEETFTAAENSERVSYVRGKLQVPITAHLPQTLGTTLGIITGLGASATLYLGKICGYLFYLICCYWGIKLAPTGKLILFYTSLLPFALEISSSYSYDSTVLALAALMIGYVLYLKFSKQKVLIRDSIIWMILTVWIAPCKIVYVFLTGLILMVPKEKFKNKFYYWGTAGISIFMGGLAIIGNRLSSISYAVTGENPEYFTVSMFFQDIPESLLMIGRTIEFYMDEYLKQIFGGLYSWLDVNLPWTNVILYVLLFGIIILASVAEKEYTLKQRDKWIMGSVSLIIIAAVAASLMFSWTLKEADLIMGIQGRYFMPVLPLMGLLFQNRIFILRKNIEKGIVISMVLLQFMTVMQLFSLVIRR